MRDVADSLTFDEALRLAHKAVEDSVDIDAFDIERLGQWVVDTLDYVGQTHTAGEVTAIMLPACDLLKVGEQFQINVSARHVFTRDQLRLIAANLLRIAESD